jgi:hypothetical protein
MLNAAMHLDAHPERPFAAAQGDTVRHLRLMRIGRNELRPYMMFDRLPGYFVKCHNRPSGVPIILLRGIIAHPAERIPVFETKPPQITRSGWV